MQGMTTVFRVSAILAGLTGAVAAAQVWEPAGTLPTGGATRQYAAGVNHNGKLYAIGGTPWQNGGDGDGVVHQLSAGVWTTTASLDGMGPIIGGAAAVDGLNRIIVYGGYILGDGGPGEAKIYDPIQGPNTNVAERRAPESAIGLFAWATDAQGRLYGIGGGPGAGGPNSGYCDRYDPVSDAWSVLAPMPTPAADACAAYDGAGHVLVFGGIDAAGNARLANVAQYDVASNAWNDTAIPDMPVALSGPRAVLGADGRIYVIGGETGAIGAGTAQTAVYKLDLAVNSWSAVASLATPRKSFACVLADDDYIYAIGGDNDTGGTNTVERLFTPRCPSISGPNDQMAFAGSIAGFVVTVSGASPFTYQWRKNGVNLSDGPTGWGSTIAGATTASLTISKPTATDAGSYDVVVSNACGTATSAAATLTIRNPPFIGAQWDVIAIHPMWAQYSSYARGISSGRIGGYANTPTILPDGRTFNLDHPVVWDDATLTPSDVTPPGSVGGAIYDVEGAYLVGWFWHTWQCWGGSQYWTCAWQSAGYWTAPTMSFIESVHSSGAEFDSLYATDGERMVGTLTYEYTEGNYDSQAHLWTPPNGVTSLHFAPATDTSATAIDGNFQYGNYYVQYGSSHAVMWTGSAVSHVDIHPAGYSSSSVSGAGDNQAVGTATSGNSHAVLWTNGGAALVDLHPIGAASSSAAAAHGGMQAGIVDGRAALWIGSAESHFDLGAIVPDGFTASGAEDFEIAPDGSVTVVGYGFNTYTNRYEALVWRSSTACEPCDTNCDGSINGFDVEDFVAALSGSGSGCSPCQGDVNGDGSVNGFDIDGFVTCLTGP
ncbi:MAG: hypothetical protein CHACPFDD_00184 [Phycisphaerae bacterium]|nr:hypothetical protein [Phycisphaerae bacterium]